MQKKFKDKNICKMLLWNWCFPSAYEITSKHIMHIPLKSVYYIAANCSKFFVQQKNNSKFYFFLIAVICQLNTENFLFIFVAQKSGRIGNFDYILLMLNLHTNNTF